jgi:hypothetical protein
LEKANEQSNEEYIDEINSEAVYQYSNKRTGNSRRYSANHANFSLGE